MEGQEVRSGFPSLWVRGEAQAEAVRLLVLLAALQRETDGLSNGAWVALRRAGRRRRRRLGSNWTFFCALEERLAELLLIVRDLPCT